MDVAKFIFARYELSTKTWWDLTIVSNGQLIL